LRGAEGVGGGVVPPPSLGVADSLLFLLCFLGLFCVVLCCLWRSLSFLDVTRKGLVRRHSTLAVAVIHVPSDILWGWSSLLCFRLFGSCVFFAVFHSWRGAYAGFALVFGHFPSS